MVIARFCPGIVVISRIPIGERLIGSDELAITEPPGFGWFIIVPVMVRLIIRYRIILCVFNNSIPLLMTEPVLAVFLLPVIIRLTICDWIIYRIDPVFGDLLESPGRDSPSINARRMTSTILKFVRNYFSVIKDLVSRCSISLYRYDIARAIPPAATIRIGRIIFEHFYCIFVVIVNFNISRDVFRQFTKVSQRNCRSHLPTRNDSFAVVLIGLVFIRSFIRIINGLDPVLHYVGSFSFHIP